MKAQEKLSVSSKRFHGGWCRRGVWRGFDCGIGVAYKRAMRVEANSTCSPKLGLSQKWEVSTYGDTIRHRVSGEESCIFDAFRVNEWRNVTRDQYQKDVLGRTL